MANKQGIQNTKSTDAIEYGIRGKSQKNIVNTHGKSGKAIEYAKIRIPKSDFDRREEIGHSAEVNPNP